MIPPSVGLLHTVTYMGAWISFNSCKKKKKLKINKDPRFPAYVNPHIRNITKPLKKPPQASLPSFLLYSVLMTSPIEWYPM